MRRVMVFSLVFTSTVAWDVDLDTNEGLTSTYRMLSDKHISDLLPLQEDETLNREWNSRLGLQTMLQCGSHCESGPSRIEFDGKFVHQVYTLPWPLLDRDLLMQCVRDIDRKRWAVTTRCRSVRHASRPPTSDRVRMEIVGSKWEMLALPGGKTQITLQLTVPKHDSIGMPRWVVDYVQRFSLRDNVVNFLKAAERLKLPPHAELQGWLFEADLVAQQCGGAVGLERHSGGFVAVRIVRNVAVAVGRKLRVIKSRPAAADVCAPSEAAHGLWGYLPTSTRLWQLGIFSWLTLPLLVGLLLVVAYLGGLTGGVTARRRRMSSFRAGRGAIPRGAVSTLPRPASVSANADIFSASPSKGLRQTNSCPGTLSALASSPARDSSH